VLQVPNGVEFVAHLFCDVPQWVAGGACRCFHRGYFHALGLLALCLMCAEVAAGDIFENLGFFFCCKSRTASSLLPISFVMCLNG
jgi:hypothetical protein